MWISQSEAARLPQVNVSKQRINALVSQGRLSTNPKKQVNVQDVLRAFTRDADPAWDAQKNTPNTSPGVPMPPPQVESDAEGELSASFRDARTRQALINAERQQFELDRQRGLYLPKAEVERAMEAAGRKLRQLLDVLPLLADELFAAAQGGGAADLKKLMREKTRRLQESLADTIRLAGHQEDDASGA